jgi:RNA polymerase sigma-70 factor, ECF subfamily
MSVSSQPEPKLDPLVHELFRKSGGEKLGLAEAQFAAALDEVARKYLPAEAPPAAARELWSSLHVEELAVARACAAGSETAWETFLIRYREKLFDAARAIAKEDVAARELADSLYADLYGTSQRGGQRVSKLNSYMGRGSLEGWLRTVMAQEFVNRFRAQRRTVSLQEKEEEGAQFPAPAAELPAHVDERLERATDEALTSIGSEERFILASYYLDGRTLAEIGRVLGVHESTISRKLEKITAAVQRAIKQGLVHRGMSRRQAEEALEVDVRDLSIDIRARLAQETGALTFSEEGAGERPRKGPQ